MAEGKDLLSVLWSGADVLRGKLDANEYKMEKSYDDNSIDIKIGKLEAEEAGVDYEFENIASNR